MAYTVMWVLIEFAILFIYFFPGNGYRDILHCNKKPFYLKGLEEDSSIMEAYIMHSVCSCHLQLLDFHLFFLKKIKLIISIRYLVFVVLIG